MPRDTEDAIRVAILYKPELFGLSVSDVNPMLQYVHRCLEEGVANIPADAWKQCFDAVNATLHEKTVEVFTGLSVVRGKAQAEAVVAEMDDDSEPEPESEPEPIHKAGNGKPSGNGKVTGSPGRDLSTKQLRYMGYLCRQLGEEPDYSVISKLSQKEATLRIRDLEAKVNG